MRRKCPTCPREVQAPTRDAAIRMLAMVHVCDSGPVDPDNDPRRPKSDEHEAQMEAARHGLTTNR